MNSKLNMKILILDNYDSFTYNLYQYVGEILAERGSVFALEVKRNDETTLEAIKRARYDRIIISPGPGDPADKKYFGVCADVLLELPKTTRILGVCLGMQGMAHYYGGKIVPARVPMHGKTSVITHDGKGLFRGLPDRLLVMRYHSLVVQPSSLPKDFEITARTIHSNKKTEPEIMGLRHKKLLLEGIQFHPESFATEGGKQMLRNFLTNKK